MKKKILITFFLLLLVGCNSAGNLTPTPAETGPKLATQDPHIRGTITQIYSDGEVISGFLVEGTLDPDTRYASASVGIDSKTLVYRQLDGTYSPIDVTDISMNSQVEVLFTGPIRTSEPVQATAEEIFILK